MKRLYVENREEWRIWLSGHHDTETGIWLVFFKKGSGRPSVEYGASVEEALCFGWIDSIINMKGTLLDIVTIIGTIKP